MTSVACYMINLGANPTLKDWKGYDAICYAIKSNNCSLVQDLIQLSEHQVNLNAYITVSIFGAEFIH